MKRCPRCGASKDHHAFRRSPRTGAIFGTCRDCLNAAKRASRVRKVRPTVVERFWSRIDKTESCWNWRGGLNSSGYGSIGVGGRVVLVHRWAYEHFVGPIPPGLQIDHLCRNRRCANPAHLEPVTASENCRRGECGAHLQDYNVLAAAERARTHCPYGHPYDERNTLRYRGQRRCKTCHRRRIAEYKRARTKTARGIPHDVRRGVRATGAKLTDERVLDILRRVAAGEKQRDIARDLGVSEATVSNVAHGKTWRHVAAANDVVEIRPAAGEGSAP
jgi:hypothetical protein